VFLPCLMRPAPAQESPSFQDDQKPVDRGKILRWSPGRVHQDPPTLLDFPKENNGNRSDSKIPTHGDGGQCAGKPDGGPCETQANACQAWAEPIEENGYIRHPSLWNSEPSRIPAGGSIGGKKNDTSKPLPGVIQGKSLIVKDTKESFQVHHLCCALP